MRHPALPLLALIALALASCAERRTTTAAAPPPPASPVKAAAAQSCVNLRQIRESLVRSDKLIDFVLIDGKVLRNRLSYACPQLGFERSFTYATSLNQLCSVDIITVLIQGGGPSRGASCGLGEFTPISAEAAKAPLAPEDR